MDAATNAGRQYLDDMPKPAAGVMRMSADDDDQTDQQRDPDMTETDRPVLETP